MYIRSFLTRILSLHPSNVHGIKEKTVKFKILPGFNFIEEKDFENIKDLNLFKKYEAEGKLQMSSKSPDGVVNEAKIIKTNRIAPKDEKKAKS